MKRRQALNLALPQSFLQRTWTAGPQKDQSISQDQIQSSRIKSRTRWSESADPCASSSPEIGPKLILTKETRQKSANTPRNCGGRRGVGLGFLWMLYTYMWCFGQSPHGPLLPSLPTNGVLGRPAGKRRRIRWSESAARCASSSPGIGQNLIRTRETSKQSANNPRKSGGGSNGGLLFIY